jgi:NADH-quinone oxidoreductase subunit H
MFKTAFAFPKKSTARLLVAVTMAAALGLPGALFAGVLFLTPLIQQPMLDAFVREQLGHDPASWGGTQVVYALAFAITAFVLFNFGAIFGGIFSWLERRVAGRMQSRIGPNRVGAGGFLQWLADAVKLLFKEDLVPAEADALLFRIAPYFVVTGFALTLVALPFGQSLIMADLGVGIFYITSVTALVVVGILLCGWSSNSKWALFGGMRSAAQVVSYEIPAGLAIMTPVLMAGTLSMQGIIRAQGGWPWEWFLFRNPAALVAFFILFASQLAEGNRTPFDLPEAESELVAGYMTEYSGFRFALFFLVEWGNLWVMSAIAVTLFLGGWQLPGVPAAQWAAWRGAAGFPPALWWGMQLVSLLWFSAKTLTLVGVVMWIRWTLPRIRVDQMMTLCWKYLVPAAFACFLFTLLWQLLVGSAPAVESVTGVVLFAAGVLVLALFARQTRENIALVAGDKVDLSNW